MLLLCCIVYLCIVVCSCIVYFSYSGMEERLCRMPEFKLINQSINQSTDGTKTMARYLGNRNDAMYEIDTSALKYLSLSESCQWKVTLLYIWL